MAQEERNRWTEWLEVARVQAPVLRERVAEWLAAARENPALIWQSAVIRYATFCAGGILLIWIALGVAHSLVPPPPASARPAATAADYHVVCANAECGKHFQVHREFGFAGFPVECVKCKEVTGVRARRCNSSVCGGRWVVPYKADGRVRCSRCDGTLD